MKNLFNNKKRIIIKIGSALLIKDDQIQTKWLKSLAEDILYLKNLGKEIIIVSSGAIALGKNKLSTKKTLKLEEKQAAAAIGQITLMSSYQNYFSKIGLDIAQIVLTSDDANDRSRYLNARNTFNSLLKNNIIPIVNENDTVAIDEIKIGDNDRLAARIAQITIADLLILLSDIDGLYDKNPKIHSNAKFIPLIENIDKSIEQMAGNSISDVGTGGMITKIKAAKMAFNMGCDTIIADGKINNPIKKIINNGKFSLFKASGKKINSKKQWIADCLNAKGEAIINKCAISALSKGFSLLPIGIVKINGSFDKGDVIFIKDENGKHLASGVAKYNSLNANLVIGKNNQEELIHCDDLVVFDFG